MKLTNAHFYFGAVLSYLFNKSNYGKSVEVFIHPNDDKAAYKLTTADQNGTYKTRPLYMLSRESRLKDGALICNSVSFKNLFTQQIERDINNKKDFFVLVVLVAKENDLVSLNKTEFCLFCKDEYLQLKDCNTFTIKAEKGKRNFIIIRDRRIVNEIKIQRNRLETDFLSPRR